MYNLLRKELIFNQRLFALFAIFPLYLIVLGISDDGFEAVFMISILWSSILLFIILSREEKYKGYPFICSLPINKKQLFISKYITAWGAFTGAFLYFISSGYVIAKIFGSSYADHIFSIDPRNLVSGIIILSLNIAIFLPLSIRFGSGKSMIIGIAIINFFGAVFLALSKAGGPFGFIYSSIMSFINSISFASNYLFTEAGAVIFWLSIFFIVFLINYISYRIVLIVFRKREL